jgi:hypothetical protein
MPFTAINHGASFTAFAPTYYGDDFFLPYQSPTYVIDGAAATGFLGFKLTHSLGVEELQAAPGLLLDEIIVQNRDSDLEFTRRYEDKTLWQKIYFGGGVAATTAIATGSFEAAQVQGVGATLRKVRLVVPILSYGNNKLTELDPDGKTIIETVSAQILKGPTTAWYIEVNNNHPSSYTS